MDIDTDVVIGLFIYFFLAAILRDIFYVQINKKRAKILIVVHSGIVADVYGPKEMTYQIIDYDQGIDDHKELEFDGEINSAQAINNKNFRGKII